MDTAMISEVANELIEKPVARVIFSTLFAGKYIVDMFVGEQLPNIC